MDGCETLSAGGVQELVTAPWLSLVILRYKRLCSTQSRWKRTLEDTADSPKNMWSGCDWRWRLMSYNDFLRATTTSQTGPGVLWHWSWLPRWRCSSVKPSQWLAWLDSCSGAAACEFSLWFGGGEKWTRGHHGPIYRSKSLDGCRAMSWTKSSTELKIGSVLVVNWIDFCWSLFRCEVS
jgi:hypothetical protein